MQDEVESSRLTDAEVEACRLIAGFQVERHGEVGGDPQRKSRQGLPQGERRRPEQKLLGFLFAAHGSVGHCGKTACCHGGVGIDAKER